MGKDPEKSGSTEGMKEDIDDMLVGAGKNPQQLRILLQFLEEMIRIAVPCTNKVTGEIRAPKGQLPLSQLSTDIRGAIDRIDGAFAETMSYTAWIQVFQEGYRRVKRTLEQMGITEINESLR